MTVLWKCLKPEQLAKLIEYQWDAHGDNLMESLSSKPEPSVTVTAELEDIEDIDKIMRKAPESRRALGD